MSIQVGERKREEGMGGVGRSLQVGWVRGRRERKGWEGGVDTFLQVGKREREKGMGGRGGGVRTGG